MYFYASHLGGGIYYSKTEITDLFCETCGDGDAFLFGTNDREVARKELLRYGTKDIDEILNGAFGKENISFYELQDLSKGMVIDDFDKLKNIKDTLILLAKTKISKKKSAYTIVYIGEYNIANVIDIVKGNCIIPVYNPSTPKFDYSKECSVNSHCVNSNITYSILDEQTMKDAGFCDKYYQGTKNEEDAHKWYAIKYINFPLLNKYHSFEVTLNISLPKDNSDINISVLDEDFCQPYDYQSMLKNNPNFEAALLVFEQVEFWMKYYEYFGILSGHNYGEYI